MDDELAPYACDKCRSRKISCSRDPSGCQRCKSEDAECKYSRAGVIRRNRKRKHETSTASHDSSVAPSHSHGTTGGNSTVLQSHLARDIAVTQERLNGLHDSQDSSSAALSSLAEACAAVWYDASDLGRNGNKYFLFEDHADAWANTLVDTLNRGAPLSGAAPPDVVNDLRASRPDKVQDRAWLVIYYSVILAEVSSSDPTNKSTKEKLRCNLWLALNDIRLLLEPSESNIHALLLVASHVEEFTTPSLSWMLVSNACRMLQALGVNNRRLDAETRQRRTMIFWHLNLVDKGLAVIFGRPPTLHRAMAREIPLPGLEQFLTFRPHLSFTGSPGSFGAHFIYQKMGLSRIMADLWFCLYEDAAPNDHSIGVVKGQLEAWYGQAKIILDAAAMTEKPFLDIRGATSIDLGLRSVDYNHNYLLMLLTRASDQMKPQCIESSKRMLHLLNDLVSDSVEMYNGIIWQLVCSPFTPLLVLFGEVLSGKNDDAENQDALVAMEQLPIFLGKMSLKNSLAAKLERISVVLVQHARSVVAQSQESPASEAPQDSCVSTGTVSTPLPSIDEFLQWDALFSQMGKTPASDQPQIDWHDTQPSDLSAWTNSLLEDPIIDWISWDTLL